MTDKYLHINPSETENSVWHTVLRTLGRPEVYVVFALALVLRGALAERGIDQQGLEPLVTAAGDAKAYLSMARAIIAGEGAAESGIFTYGPGNVWYLAAVLWLSKGSIFGVLIMNLLLSSLACVFVYVVTGFTLYQGSRLMYPAYFAGDILIAVGVAGPILLFRQLVSKPRSVKSNSDRP